jgi:hypothetical protein
LHLIVYCVLLDLLVTSLGGLLLKSLCFENHHLSNGGF